MEIINLNSNDYKKIIGMLESNISSHKDHSFDYKLLIVFIAYMTYLIMLIVVITCYDSNKDWGVILTVVGLIVNFISLYIIIFQLKNMKSNNYIEEILICLLIDIDKQSSENEDKKITEIDLKKLLNKLQKASKENTV